MSNEKCEVCERNVGTAADYTAAGYRDVCWARSRSHEALADCRRIGYEREKEMGARLAALVKSLDESRTAAEAKHRDLLLACEEALIWCSGADAFKPDGIAALGWQRVVLPVLEQIRIARAALAPRDSAPVCDCDAPTTGGHWSTCATRKPRDSGKDGYCLFTGHHTTAHAKSEECVDWLADTNRKEV